MRLVYSFILFAVLLSNSMRAQNKNEPLRYLALGDSYTIGESVAEGERWPVQLAEALTQKGIRIAKPEIIAVTGWRTDDLMNGISAARPREDYDLVSLLIGVNNQYQGKPISEYELEFEDLLKAAIHYSGGKRERVFVVSIPDYGYTPLENPSWTKSPKPWMNLMPQIKKLLKSMVLRTFILQTSPDKDLRIQN